MNSKSFFKNHNLLSIETYQNDDLKILNNINSIDDIKRNFNKPILIYVFQKILRINIIIF